jgi:hypothetical protein
MHNIVVISYSQSGQTQRAVDGYVTRLAGSREVSVHRLVLQAEPAWAESYRFPWSFFSFLRALPDSVTAAHGAKAPALSLESTPESAGAEASTLLATADLVVIAYPVWFLCPAVPISVFLRSSAAQSLVGKTVHTVATCRNMWVQAQLTVRRLVEHAGGKVARHAILEDRGPAFATLITTPRYFLTGKRTFSSSALSRVFPPFGVDERAYAELEAWASDWEASPVHCHFNPSMALAEYVGKGIFRLLLVPWHLVRTTPRLVQNVYLSFVAACTAAGIVCLMPPLVLLGRLPPLRRRILRWQTRLCSIDTSHRSAFSDVAAHGAALTAAHAPTGRNP